MIQIVNKGVVTADFHQQRPLNGPYTHVHGAHDVAGGDGIVRAPVNGTAIACVFLMGHTVERFLDKDKDRILAMPVHRYYEPVYGGLVTIIGEDGTYHVLAHFWPAQLQARFGKFEYVESIAQGQSVAKALISEPLAVARGDKLGPMGNAGFSTGPHVHWEIHPRVEITPHAGRIDPAKYR